MKVGQAKQIQPFVMMAFSNFSVVIEFEAGTDTRWLAAVSNWNEFLSQ